MGDRREEKAVLVLDDAAARREDPRRERGRARFAQVFGFDAAGVATHRRADLRILTAAVKQAALEECGMREARDR